MRKECFFFFQAEDGIRDLYVTGVQTCALPISRADNTASIAHPMLIGFSFGWAMLAVLSARVEGQPPRWAAIMATAMGVTRSEERRVGKECWARGARYH